MFKKIIISLLLLGSSTICLPQEGQGTSYFQSTMHSLNTVMYIVHRNPEAVNTLLDPDAAELYYDLMQKAEELEDKNTKRDLFWKERLEEVSSSELELIELQPMEAIFSPYSEDPEKFKEFRTKYKGEIYNIIRSKTFVIKAVSDYKKEKLGFIHISKATDHSGQQRPYVRMFADNISPEQVVKICAMIMQLEKVEQIFMAQRTPFISNLDLARTSVGFNNASNERTTAYIVSDDILKETIIRNLKKEYNPYRDWKNSIELFVRPQKRKYYIDFKAIELLPKWKRVVVVASYLYIFDPNDEPSMNAFYNKLDRRFGLTKQDIDLGTTMMNKDYQNIDQDKLKRLKDMGVTEQLFKKIFNTAPSNVASHKYSDNIDQRSLLNIIDTESQKTSPDLNIISDSWSKIMAKTHNDQWADKFLDIISSPSTKLGVKKAMMTALSYSDRIPKKLYNIIDQDWAKTLDIAAIFQNKKNLPWEFWSKIIDIIRDNNQTFIWWNTLSKQHDWPRSFREHVPELIKHSDSRILIPLAEQEGITKEEYQAVAELMLKKDLSKNTIYSINHFLKKRKALPRMIWENMIVYSNTYGMNNSGDMFNILSNKDQIPREVSSKVYTSIKFESNTVLMERITDPSFLKLFGTNTSSFTYAMGQRQFNEDAYSLRIYKFYNERLYLLRYKYKTMGTTELLNNLQSWIDKCNYENKYGNDWLPRDNVYYSALDFILSEDFDIMLNNIQDFFIRDIPKNFIYNSNSAEMYQSTISDLLSSNTANDFFMMAEIELRLRERMLRAPNKKNYVRSYDPLNIFSDYGLMVGFLGNDPTMSIKSKETSMTKLYAATLEKLFSDESVTDKDKRAFATEGRFVSNLRSYALRLRNGSEKTLSNTLKNTVSRRMDLGGIYDQDIEDFMIYALEEISRTPNPELMSSKIMSLAESLPSSFDVLKLAVSDKLNESDPLLLKNTITLVRAVSIDTGPKAQNLMLGLQKRLDRSIINYEGPQATLISPENAIQALQKYTGSESGDMKELRSKALELIVANEGKLDDNTIEMLFSSEEKEGYYDYLSRNAHTEEDICELILLSCLCYSNDNFSTISRSDLRFVAGTFSKFSNNYQTNILNKYNKNEKNMPATMYLIKSSVLSPSISYGYQKLSVIKF